jgi:protein phosphatase
VDEPLQVDESSLEAREGDRLLLCSDGLHSMVSDQAIEEVLETIPDPQEAANRLIDMANQAGGLDNITVMILDFEPGDGIEGTIVAPPNVQDIDRGGTAEMPVMTPVQPDRTDITVARPIPVIPPAGGPGSATAPPPAPGVATATPSPQAPARPSPPTAPAAPAGSLEPPRRRRRRLMVVGVVLLGVVAVLIGARLWLDTRWYVGVHEVEGEERVAVFRGMPTVIFGIRLDGLVADEFDRSTITLDELARAPEARLWIAKLRDGVIVGSQEEAERTVEQIRTDLEAGAQGDGTTPGGTQPSPAPTVGASPTG